MKYDHNVHEDFQTAPHIFCVDNMLKFRRTIRIWKYGEASFVTPFFLLDESVSYKYYYKNYHKYTY